MELFLLLGENYVQDSQLGRECHQKRIKFETAMVEHGFGEKLSQLYSSLADLDLGRQIVVFAQNT